MSELVNTEKLVDIISKSVNVISEVLEDGKVDVNDLPSVFKFVGIFQSAAGINFQDFLNEITKVQSTDVKLIADKLSSSLDISNDKAEQTLKFWISFASNLYSLFTEGYELIKSIKS